MPTVGQDLLDRLARMADEKRRDWLAGNADAQSDFAALEWGHVALRELVEDARCPTCNGKRRRLRAGSDGIRRPCRDKWHNKPVRP